MGKTLQKFMDWLQYKVTPAVQKFTERARLLCRHRQVPAVHPHRLSDFLLQCCAALFSQHSAESERSFKLHLQHVITAGSLYDGLSGNGFAEAP